MPRHDSALATIYNNNLAARGQRFLDLNGDFTCCLWTRTVSTAAVRARTRLRIALCTGSGTHTAVNSPARSNRASVVASAGSSSRGRRACVGSATARQQRDNQAHLSHLAGCDACKPLMLLGWQPARPVCGAKAGEKCRDLVWIFRI
jgi:hypothetical protein